MIRTILAISTFVAATLFAGAVGHAVVVVSEDFFYQETTVIPTSFGEVRFAKQNYGGGQSGAGGAWNERWSGNGAGTIVSDDTTVDTPTQPFMSNPFTARFNGENSVNNDIRRAYQIANTVPAQQTLYFGGRFKAAEPGTEGQSMFVDFGIVAPTGDLNSNLVSIGLQNDTFFGQVGLIASIEQGETELVSLGSQTVLGNALLPSDAVVPGTYRKLVGKLEFNVGGANTRADYNLNGVTDAGDYTIWRDNLGMMGGALLGDGDGTGDGNVTQEDYDMWRHNAYSTLDRLTVYIDPTGVETSSGSTLVALGEVGDGINALKGTLQARLSGGFTGSREMFVDDVAIGTTWNDVINPVVPRLNLNVNPTTGAVTLVNNSSTAIDLAYYEILSDSGALNTAGWSSLDDQNTSGGTWLENNPSANALRESNLTGSTTLAAGGGSLSLGNAFAIGGTQDLLARFGTKQGAQGLLNLVGNVNYGALAAGAVPEPSSVTLLAMGAICLSRRFRASA
jgi:hypothetical protein